MWPVGNMLDRPGGGGKARPHTQSVNRLLAPTHPWGARATTKVPLPTRRVIPSDRIRYVPERARLRDVATLARRGAVTAAPRLDKFSVQEPPTPEIVSMHCSRLTNPHCGDPPFIAYVAHQGELYADCSAVAWLSPNSAAAMNSTARAGRRFDLRRIMLLSIVDRSRRHRTRCESSESCNRDRPPMALLPPPPPRTSALFTGVQPDEGN
jgi:hypothetical protein